MENISATSYVTIFFFMFNELMWEVIVSFVDFGGIVKFNNNNVLKLYRNERERRQQGQQLITAPEKNGEM